MSITVIEEADANRMLAEMVRVTKPGGRVAVVARAMDMPFLMHLPLPASLKAKVEAPGVMGGVAPQGCADASLYRRMHNAGLTQVKMLPQLPAFDLADAPMLQFMQDSLLPKLSHDEASDWHTARAGRGRGHLLHDMAASLRGGDEDVLSAALGGSLAGDRFGTSCPFQGAGTNGGFPPNSAGSKRTSKVS